MKELSSATKKLYRECLNRLEKNNIKYKNINDGKDLIKELYLINKDNSISYTRLYLTSILWYHRMNGTINDKTKILTEEIFSINKKISYEYDLNELSENEYEKYLEWDEIVDVFDKLYNKRNTSKVQFKKCLTIGLYVLFPPRRVKDYSGMIILESENDMVKKDCNYYIISNKKFFFGDYKMSGTYGVQQFDVPENLSNLLEEYINKFNLTGKKLLDQSACDLSEKIKRIFTGQTGKGATVNTMRHSYISYMSSTNQLNNTLKKKELALKMGHSHIIQQDIYFKQKK
jgi:hypothetical protein